MFTLTWVEEELPGDVTVRQVYAFILAPDGRILVQDDEGRHNLPGGKPEAGESYVQTLEREAVEESQVAIKDIRYLGYQLVESEEEKFAQLRYSAVIETLLPRAVDPSTGREYRRLWVPPPLVNGLLGWGHSGAMQVARAEREADRLGLIWDGTPSADADEVDTP